MPVVQVPLLLFWISASCRLLTADKNRFVKITLTNTWSGHFLFIEAAAVTEMLKWQN